jgi:hypothetical protein
MVTKNENQCTSRYGVGQRLFPLMCSLPRGHEGTKHESGAGHWWDHLNVKAGLEKAIDAVVPK